MNLSLFAALANFQAPTLALGWGCAVVPLLALSLGLQLYIGRTVYFRQPDVWLKSLNPIRTFRLGWQNLDLYPYMIMWSLVLAALVITVILASALLVAANRQ